MHLECEFMHRSPVDEVSFPCSALLRDVSHRFNIATRLVPELVFQDMGNGLTHISHLSPFNHHFDAVRPPKGISRIIASLVTT
jgi:hypothetical protein